MYTNNEKPGAYTGFFLKEKQWAADSCTGRERGDINPPMGARRKGGGQPKMTPHREKKVPYIETKVAKRPPHSEKVAKRPPIQQKKKDFPG